MFRQASQSRTASFSLSDLVSRRTEDRCTGRKTASQAMPRRVGRFRLFACSAACNPAGATRRLLPGCPMPRIALCRSRRLRQLPSCCSLHHVCGRACVCVSVWWYPWKGGTRKETLDTCSHHSQNRPSVFYFWSKNPSSNQVARESE